MTKGDPNWLAAYDELRALHIEKSSTYGTDADRLANFTAVAAVTCGHDEKYVLERIIEKSVRALHMLGSGRADQVKEYKDIASLALCAEALRRRSANRYIRSGIPSEVL